MRSIGQLREGGNSVDGLGHRRIPPRLPVCYRRYSGRPLRSTLPAGEGEGYIVDRCLLMTGSLYPSDDLSPSGIDDRARIAAGRRIESATFYW